MSMRISTIFMTIVLLLGTLDVTAADTTYTNATITTWAKSFNDASEGGSMVGANIKIVALSFLVDGKIVGSISRENLMSPGIAQINNEISLNKSNPEFSVLVTYSHHEWNLLGTIHYYPRLTKLISAGEISFSHDNASVSGTFNSFNPLDETIEVDWSFNFTILISSAEPSINQMKTQCYNQSSYLSLKSNNPDFYNNSGVSYHWQYGFPDTWQTNYDFLYFLDDIINWLSLKYEGNEPFLIENIQMALYNTDYDFMNSYYALYEDIENNKVQIAYSLESGICAQNIYLTAEETTFLFSYFVEAVMSQPTCPPPNTLGIANWTDLGTTYIDSILLNPADFIPVSPVVMKAGFRVRAYKSGYSPFSEISVAVFKPGAPSFTVNQPVSCPNRPTGEIILSGVTGVPPLNDFRCLVIRDGDEAGLPDSFSGQNHTINKVFEAGSYTVKVYYNDPAITGCSVDKHINIGQHSQLSYSYTAKNETCPEKNDGEITVNVTEHQGDYSFQLNDRIITNSDIGAFNDLIAGTYVLKVTDQCYTGLYGREETIQIKEPATVTMNITGKIDPTCLSSPNGIISVQTSGGNEVFDYQVIDHTGSVTFSATGQGTSWSANQLPGGNYFVKTRSEGCEWKTSESQSLVPVQQISFTANVTDAACFGESTGQISLTASGGKAPYYYSIGYQEFSNDHVFGSLSAGTYYLQVHTSEMTCNDIASGEIIVGSAPKIEIGLKAVDASCYEKADGQIIASVSGGTGPYYYSWEQSGSDGGWFPEAGNSGVIANLYAGTYRLNVTDSENCRQSGQVLITEPPLLVIESAVPRDVACFGGNGSIEILAAGGSGGYEFSCTNDLEHIHKSSVSTISLPAGEYSVRVKDAKGCETAYENHVTVTGPDSPLDFMVSAPEFNGFNLPCAGDASGKITIEASGGNGPGYEGYMYSLSGSTDQEANIIGGLRAGVYSIKVTDGRKCTVQKSFRITEPEQLTLELVSSKPVSCFGSPEGEIAVTAKGGIENTYEYTFAGSETESTGVYKNILAGTYEIEVSDLNGCRKSISTTVQSLNPPIEISVLSLTKPLCAEDEAGKITLTAAGGDQPYEYSINGGIYAASPEFTNLRADRYSFKVRDRNGCTGTFDTDILSAISEMMITGSVSDVKCFGENSGAINVYVTGGSKPFTYRWKDMLPGSSSVTGLKNGDYTLYITDSAGCKAEKNFRINQPSAPLSIKAISYPACVGLQNGMVTATASGGAPPYRYSLDESFVHPMTSSFNVYAGNHSVYVADANNCISETGIIVNVKNIMPDLNFMLATSRYELDTLVVIDVSVPAPDKVTWGFSSEAFVIDTSSFDARIKYTHAGIYPVKMTGHFGTCAYTIEKLLNISPSDPYAIGENRNRGGIKSLKISPNPNDGRFELRAELYSKQKVTVKVFDFQSRLMFSEIYPADTAFTEEIYLPGTLMPGTYVLWIISENDSRPAVFVISR